MLGPNTLVIMLYSPTPFNLILFEFNNIIVVINIITLDSHLLQNQSNLNVYSIMIN